MIYKYFEFLSEGSKLSSKKNRNDRMLKFKENKNYSENIKELDLNQFPLIEDFEIIIKDCGKNLGLHLYYFSKKLGKTIASFPWWDNVNRDFVNMSLDNIPIGNIESPFDKLEQSWQIVIWEKRDFVYIIEGEDPCCFEFPRWFKVEKAKYFAEWDRILKMFREGTPLTLFKRKKK